MDYKETTVAGQRWHRFSKIVIDNPRPGTPSVLCVEQEVIALGDTEVSREVNNLYFPFNPEAVFPVLNPVTGQATGDSATGGMVYALVWSLVMAEAAKRDAHLASLATDTTGD